MELKSKASQVREYIAADEWDKAFRLAASFQDLGKQRSAILDARMAFTNPRFLKQLGKDVDATIEAGKAAIRDRYPPLD